MAAVKWYGEEFKRDMERVVRGKLTVVGDIVIEQAKELMRESKSGKPGSVTKRSAPGEAPAIQTARLKDSIAQEPIEDRLGVRVGTNVKYGRYLEYGTRGGTIIKPKRGRFLSWIGPDGVRVFARQVVQGAIAPRPWLRPALERSRKAIKTIFGKT